MLASLNIIRRLIFTRLIGASKLKYAGSVGVQIQDGICDPPVEEETTCPSAYLRP